MLTKRDLSERSVVLLNCLERNYKIKVVNHNLVVLDKDSNEVVVKLIKQKVFAVFILGRVSITTVVLQKCADFDIALCFLKSNFSCFAFLGDYASANYQLRYHQYHFVNKLNIAKFLVANKLNNQIVALNSIRKKDNQLKQAITKIRSYQTKISDCVQLKELMGYEGNAARLYFKNIYQPVGWVARKPQARIDPINTLLDIGYSFLFNYTECFLRLYGFDLYMGNLHQLWFKRKSLVCDLMEPLRPLIDLRLRKAFNRGEISEQDFKEIKGQFILRQDKIKKVCDLIALCLIEKKRRYI